MNLNISQQIAEIVAQEIAVTSLPKGKELIEVTGELQRLTGKYNGCSTTFYYQEYEIQVGKSWWLHAIAQTLEKLRPLSLSVAPELVAELPAGEGNTVLVSRYSACAGEELLHVYSFESAFNDEAAQRFRSEMQTLADLGLVHTYIRGGAYWMVGSKTGTIVLKEWHTLESGTPQQGVEMLRSIELTISWQQHLSSKLHP